MDFKPLILEFLNNNRGRPSKRLPIRSFSLSTLLSACDVPTSVWDEQLSACDLRESRLLLVKLKNDFRSDLSQLVRDGKVDELLRGGKFARYRMAGQEQPGERYKSDFQRVRERLMAVRHCPTCRCRSISEVAKEMGVTMKPRKKIA